MQLRPTALLLFALAAQVQAVPQGAPASSDKKGSQPAADEFIYYDYLDHEGGELKGGRVRVDPTDPLMAFTEVPAPRSRAPYTTVISNGDPANRIDLVFVGDGYQSSELSTYANHVNNVLAPFFAEHPLDKYISYFNVHRVDVVSVDSGVDNDPNQGISRNTALDMGYWCSGTQRLLCVNTGKAHAQAASAPGVDQILALANSSTYGGAGYSASNLGTLAGANGAAIEIALHEFGHSFADLADEYTYGGSSTYTGGEPGRSNLSILTSGDMTSQMKKWWRWLSEPNVGTFEGGGYSSFGIYRPTDNSLMRNLYRPLEQVNVEQFILSLYKTVSPIDAATQSGTYSTTDSFFVTPMVPASHSLDVQWRLDGVPIAGATGNTFDASTLGLGSGPYQLSVEVVDNTSWVRDENKRQSLMREVRSWTLDDQGLILPYGCGVNPAGSLTVISGTPTPGATVVLGVDNPLGTSVAGTIPIIALAVQPDTNYPCGTALPGFNMNPLIAGELLIDISPTSLLQPILFGAPYGGQGSGPAPVSVPIPNDPTLVGFSAYAQGLHFDPTGGFGVRFGLADAVQLRVGL